MHKVKFFKGGSDVALQEEINRWFEKNPQAIPVNIALSTTRGDYILSHTAVVLYWEK